ncbi:MAG: hypothetical protein WAX66_02075 [Patescibacteria group bacterium]
MHIFKENKIVLIILSLLVITLLVFTSKRDSESINLSDYKKVSERKEEDTPSEIGTGDDLPRDYEYAEATKSLLEKYPWYTKTPIDTSDYTIVWDLELEKFRIRLKVPETSSQELKDSLTAKAVEDIRTLTGEKFSEYTYYILYPRVK